MNQRKVLEQINQLRTESDPKFREALTRVADGLEAMLKGASNGGKMRKKALSKKRRSEIARKAAQARWGQR